MADPITTASAFGYAFTAPSIRERWSTPPGPQTIGRDGILNDLPPPDVRSRPAGLAELPRYTTRFDFEFLQTAMELLNPGVPDNPVEQDFRNAAEAYQSSAALSP